jgi:YfiH family protein
MEFGKDKLEWLDFGLLEDNNDVLTAVFLRHGGVSKKPYDTLNISDKIGDHPDSVKMNRQMIKELVKADDLVFANQVHGDKIIEITNDNKHKEHSCDVLVTREKNIALAIAHADCQACILYDKENEAVAAIHAGWKGLMKNVYEKTVRFMEENFNSRSADLIACISPSLGPDHAEFTNFREEFPKKYWSYKKEDKLFDLWQIAFDQLKDAGLQDNNIEIAKVCTYCNPKDYYSYRRDKVTGRHATVVCLK